MERISINDLHEVSLALDHDGFRIVKNEDGVVTFSNGKETKEIELTDYNKEKPNITLPNYDNCMLNVIASIRKYYGKKPEYKTSALMDATLQIKKYKHIAILVLDGLGSRHLQTLLGEESFLGSNKKANLSSVYPSTTSAAIPAYYSGKEPNETGWLGWATYVKELDKDVVLFKNTDYFTGDKLDFNSSEFLPYKKFYRNFNTNIFEMGPTYYEDGYETFEAMCDSYLAKISSVEDSFSMLYWDEPDDKMHEFGSFAEETKNELLSIDATLKALYEKLPEDTLIITTADHGHMDVKPIYFNNFETLTQLLQRVPSNEGRCTFFKVKPFCKEAFVRRFKRFFGDSFIIYKRSDFNTKGFIGKRAVGNAGTQLGARIRGFQGDFVACATGNYYFNYAPNVLTDADADFVMKSHHAGLTEDEMTIPFILIQK